MYLILSFYIYIYIYNIFLNNASNLTKINREICFFESYLRKKFARGNGNFGMEVIRGSKRSVHCVDFALPNVKNIYKL